VSWDDAQAYVGWLSMRPGAAYRLPTEAEREYAARAGTPTARWWGDAVGRGNANCVGCGSQWDGRMTAPVGSFRPNGFGLHDMLGNVWQWVADCWRGTLADRPSDARAVEMGECDRRVMRGGAWNLDPWSVRSGFRVWSDATDADSILGFRVARTLSP